MKIGLLVCEVLLELVVHTAQALGGRHGSRSYFRESLAEIANNRRGWDHLFVKSMGMRLLTFRN